MIKYTLKKEPSGDCIDVLILVTLETLSGHCKPCIVESRIGWTRRVFLIAENRSEAMLNVNRSSQVLSRVVFALCPLAVGEQSDVESVAQKRSKVEVVVFSSVQCTWKQFTLSGQHSAGKQWRLPRLCGEQTTEIF